jgi:hypothetical protein
MRFTDILRNVIVEQTRMDVLADKLTKSQGKNKPLLKDEELFALIVADPESKVQTDMDIDSFRGDFSVIKKVGPYAQWIIKQYLSLVPMSGDGETPLSKDDEQYYKKELSRSRSQFFEDLYKVTEYLTKFHRFKNRLPAEQRDINKLSVMSLYDAVKDFSLEKTKATKDERKEASISFEYPGAEVLYNGPNWAVTRVSDKGSLGKDAACFYGGFKEETEWCTSSPGLRWFDDYIKDGPLYQIFNKNSKPSPKTGLPEDRYQLSFARNQYMDKHDRNIKLVEFLKERAPEIKDLFKSEFARSLSKGDGSNKQLVIEYPRDASSKYVALYGWDELFKTLNSDITHIDFTNSSNETLNLKFPKELSKLRNLQTFYVENAISEVPEYLKGLEKLEFLSFPKNANLREIPEWVADLPSLIALSLKNTSDDLKIPQRLQDRIDDGNLWFTK